MNQARKWIKKSDLLLVGGILLAAVLAFWLYSRFAPRGSVKAEIYVDQTLVKTVDLQNSNEQRFSVPEHPEVVFRVYKDGSIAFEASDCPDKVCIRTGRLSRPGESAVCLPKSMVLKIVRISGDSEHDPDFIQ